MTTLNLDQIQMIDQSKRSKKIYELTKLVNELQERLANTESELIDERKNSKTLALQANQLLWERDKYKDRSRI